jgi:beta-glucanase (GH16 family)
MQRRWLSRTSRSLFLSAIAATALACSPTVHGDEMPAPPAGFKLVPGLAEEFDKPVLDPKVWGHVFADPGARDMTVPKRTLAANRERQLYFDPAYLGLGVDPFRVHDGMVTITAQTMAPAVKQAVQAELAGLPGHRDNPVLRELSYSSGLLTTRGLFVQKFGYFEARLRYSGGKGIWPGFWLLREDSRWPPEIDIVEALGHDPSTIYSSVHSSLEPKDVTRKIAFQGSPAEFHRYGAMWLPDRIDYYVDGEKTASIAAPADLDRPMYLLLNLAVGGRWPGNPDSGTRFPAAMDIDWVRTWRLEPH